MKQLLFTFTLLFTLSSFAQVPNYVPSNGLVGWWPFNGNANDESGNGNNGTVNGATLTNDRFGNANQAYGFDGVDDYISLATINQLGLSNSSFSISIWVRCSVFGQNNGEDYIIGTPMWGGGSDEGVKIQNNPQGNPYGVYSSSLGIGGQIYCASNNNFSLHSWESIVVRYNNLTGLFQMYINGNLMSSSTLIGSPLTNPYPVSVGAFVGPWISEFLSGKTDDIGIWNRALTSCEIADLFNAQVGSLNTTGSETVTECDTYTWSNNGQTYTQSGQYTAVLTNAAGCDSTVTLDLTINNADNGINQLDDITLEATANNAQYQWVDCGENYQAISGATDQTFEATVNGDYACIVTENGCSDTTACITISNVGISDISNDGISVYPNPASSTLTIESQEALNTSYRMIDAQGREVLQGKLQGTITAIDIENLAQGSYTLLFNQTELKIIKE